MEIKLAVPNKGRLHTPSVEILARAGIPLTERDERALISKTTHEYLQVIFVRASDIPKFVEAGAADLGVTGYDYITDSRAEVVELLDLEYGKAKIVLAASEKSHVHTIEDIAPSTKIATKLENLTRSFLARFGKKATVVKISGAAEIMPFIGVSDLIVDTASTGTTLKTHGLRVIAEILESSCRLIANREALSAKREKIKEVKLALESVVKARKKKLIMMNVPEGSLKEVIGAIPSMSGPTLAKVEAKLPMWEVYSVIDESEVYQTIHTVKRAGARDILVLPIERIIP